MTTIGWVGNYKRDLKNFDLAYRACYDEGYELSIAGPSGSLLHVPHNHMPEFYRDLDALLITSMFEAHPLILYEALACGCPVIINEGVGDAKLNDLTGIVYYTDYNLDTIKNSIELAVKHKDQLSKSAVQCMQNHWKWEDVKPLYIKMFQEASGKDNPEVLYMINERNWSWDHMYNEINKYVYPCDVLYINERSSDLHYVDFSPYDIIVNHVWFYVNMMQFDSYDHSKDIISLNGPAYTSKKNALYLKHILPEALGITTVSLPIMEEIQTMFPRYKTWYATRGLDINLFNPGS